MRKFSLFIDQKECDSIKLDSGGVEISGIDASKFMFPDSMDSDDIAKILAKEDFDDLNAIFGYLADELKNRRVKFTFKLKDNILFL